MSLLVSSPTIRCNFVDGLSNSASFSIAKSNEDHIQNVLQFMVNKGKEEIQAYDMTRNPRGVCLIINNINYLFPSGVPPIPGAEDDEYRVEQLFT
jgi:hypothetical protein